MNVTSIDCQLNEIYSLLSLWKMTGVLCLTENWNSVHRLFESIIKSNRSSCLKIKIYGKLDDISASFAVIFMDIQTFMTQKSNGGIWLIAYQTQPNFCKYKRTILQILILNAYRRAPQYWPCFGEPFWMISILFAAPSILFWDSFLSYSQFFSIFLSQTLVHFSRNILFIYLILSIQLCWATVWSSIIINKLNLQPSHW